MRTDFNNRFRTSLGTSSTSRTLFLIHFGKSGLRIHVDSIELAGSHTVAASQTAITTTRFTTIERSRNGTTLGAIVLVHTRTVGTSSITSHHRNHWFGFTGIDAMDKMNKIMNDIRTSDISSVQGKKVLALSDYLTGVTTKCDGTKEKITLPKSNVLLYTLENDCWMCVRPSGTEPKLKIYLATKEDSFNSAEKDLAAMKDEVVKKFNL